MLIIALRFFCCPIVILPPLPGEGGEIYDDVLDPNLDVRWELMDK